MMLDDTHLFLGMRRDNHPIRLDSKFLWDAHNIRLTNRDDNTFLSITNERGTSEPLLNLVGQYVGHCVLGDYLVVFTTDVDTSDNYIYRIEKTTDGYNKVILFYMDSGNLWDIEHPILTLGIQETEFIQKVYWVDGIHLPRVINITKDKLLGIDISNLNDKDKLDNIPNLTNLLWFKDDVPDGSVFDFCRDLKLLEDIYVYRFNGNGEFSPGTIQYAFSYYNKYELETGIFYTTPINYISPKDRGGSPDEKVSNTFHIDIYGYDTKFDYIRIYSIHRTSIDAVPTVKVVEDVPIPKDKTDDIEVEIEFVDDGRKGYTIDADSLLYVGGLNILVGAIALKDNTLFLGNITLNDNKVLLDNKGNKITIEDLLKEDYEITEEGLINLPKVEDYNILNNTYYDYVNSLYKSNIAGFCVGETYRVGVLALYKDGTWSLPVYIDDIIISSQYPYNGIRSTRGIQFNNISSLKNAGIKRLRTCVVYPDINDRSILCQGVLCPTVYNVGGRKFGGNVYAMSSWFFRPTSESSSDNPHSGSSIEFRHNYPLYGNNTRKAEIQSMGPSVRLDDTEVTDNNGNFFVDENIVTFNSPDIEFDTSLLNIDWSNTRLSIFGAVKLGAISGDIDIRTSSPLLSTTTSPASGFKHTTVGYKTLENKNINGGLVAGLFYESDLIKDDFTTGDSRLFMVYPWHRSGSLNNDSARPSTGTGAGTRSAVLETKKISNLKYFSEVYPLSNILEYNITTPLMFTSNELSILKLAVPYIDGDMLYYGNTDLLLTTTLNYNLYTGYLFDGEISMEKDKSTEPIRMKYKSSPHMVFSLLADDKSSIELLPRHLSLTNFNDNNYVIPEWLNASTIKPDSGKYDYDLIYVGAYLADALKYLTESDIGKYVYCLDRTSTGKDKYVVAECRKGGKRGELMLSAPNQATLDDKIFKITKNVTLSYKDTRRFLITGTSESDYTNTSYTGNDKYYRATYEQGYYIKMVEVSKTDLGINDSENVRTFKLHQRTFNTSTGLYLPYLLLANIVRDVDENTRFGGKSEEALKSNIWLPSSKSVSISTLPDDYTLIIPFEYGDTWYSRYDCLKTYPFTLLDENQIIEIGSFMCETRVNIDGRYDRNRGLFSNLNVTPLNFNLLNPVYSQKDNFFNYRILDKDLYKLSKFPSQLIFSKEKHNGEDVDTWSDITIATPIDLDGNNGPITALSVWNENILCFLDKALSQVLFNVRALIPVSDGVPIEISNGYKVDGARTISNTIGCGNPLSIIATPLGVYFIDNITNGLYLFNGQLSNLSDSNGMSWWVKTLDNNIRTFYDKINGDLYFTSYLDSLCYSEKLGSFVSFMSYGNTPAMFNFNDGFYSLRTKDNNVILYLNFVGEYNLIFGNNVGWDFSFISNANPTMAKVFDTIEFRGDVYNKNICPITRIDTKNEYLIGFRDIDSTGTNKLDIKKKFRIWRGLLPRVSDTSKGNRNNYARARLRNPWTEIKLSLASNKGYDKVVIHDVSVKYTI